MVNSVQPVGKQPIKFVAFAEKLCTCYQQNESRREQHASMSQSLDWLEAKQLIRSTAMDFHPPRRVWRDELVHLSVHW